MNTLVRAFIIGVICFFVYFGVSTNGTFRPAWALDYFNPMASSLIHGRLDLPSPPETHDLVYFRGKWFAPWGLLPAVFLIPIQLMKGRYVPPLYLSLLFGSLNVALFYALLERVKKDFFPSMRTGELLVVTGLFAFGTANFYLSMLGSVWHVDQVVSACFGTLGLYLIFRKQRNALLYILSSFAFALTLLGRATIILTIFVPVTLFILEHISRISQVTFRRAGELVRKAVWYFGIPSLLFTVLFFAYNYARFGNIFEYGYTYIVESDNLRHVRETQGIMSLANLRNNLWYFVLEIPKLTFINKPQLQFNLVGNSIFFITPPFLAAFLAVPWYRSKKRWRTNPYVLALWVGALITIAPSLLLYSTGWMQFGYRYSLDITPMLLLLSVFGLKGKLNVLYIAGTVFAVSLYWMGIHALM